MSRRLALLRDPVHDLPWRTPNLMLVRREAFERVGLFSTELRVGIGVDWYARAMECGLKEVVPPSHRARTTTPCREQRHSAA